MDCVFCDRANWKSYNKLDERLIAETKDFWIFATLGQITDGGYVILVPKWHVECVGAMAEPEADRLGSLVDVTRGILYKEYGKVSVVFEHGIVGQSIKHAHIHVVPENIFLSDKIFQDFPDSGTSAITELYTISVLYSKINKPYLLLKQFGSLWNVIWDPPAPLQYLRTISAEALGRPERANWRTMDPELDKKLWSETVRRLKPYFKSP